MAAQTGRSVAFRWNAGQVLGVREKALSINGEVINISSDEDNGWQTLLADPGEKSVTIGLSGVTKDRTLKNDFFNNNTIRPVTYTYSDGSVISGNFKLASYNEGTPYNDAVSFDADLQSTGVVTWTPGA